MTNANTGTELLAPDVSRDLAGMTAEQVDEQCAKLTRIANAQNRLIMTALTTKTRGKDWIDFGGTPYLTGDGAERLCAIGIRLGTPIFDVRHEGNDIIVDCLVEASWQFTGQTTTGLGNCSTRDKLYSKSEYRLCLERAEGNVTLARKLLEGHVKKKAYKNATGRAVCAVMGISGLSWPELAEYGITPDMAGAKVDFRKGATLATKAAVSKILDRVSIPELKALPVGSRAAIGGTIKYAEKGAKSQKYTLTGDGGTIVVYVRSQDELPDWAVAGNEVWVPEVEVGKPFQGKPMFWADKGIQLANGGEPE